MDPVVASSLVLGGAGLAGSFLGGSMSASEARRQRKFAALTMKNKYQWAVQDLIKAGINPVMAYMSSQPLASGSSATYPDLGQSLTSGVSSAVQLKKARADIEAVKAQQLKTKEEAIITGVDKDVKLNWLRWLNKPENASIKQAMYEGMAGKQANVRGEVAIPFIEMVRSLFEGQERAKGISLEDIKELLMNLRAPGNAMSMRDTIRKSQDLYRYLYKQGSRVYKGVTRWKPKVSMNRGSRQ